MRARRHRPGRRRASATPEAPPIEGTPERVAAAIRDLAEAGADEVVLVASPISEASIRRLGEALALLAGPA